MKSLAEMVKSESANETVKRQATWPRAVLIIQSLDELDRLARTWDSLGAQSASPMQHFIWARAWAETGGPDDRLQAVVVGSTQRPLAIAPLVKRRRGFGRLELLGVHELNEPMDLLYADPESLASLSTALAKLGSPVFLKRVSADSPMIGALRRAYRGRGLVICREVAGYSSIALDDGWREPEQKFNPGRRSDFRRAQRKAEKLGEVSYEVLSPALRELEPLLEEAFRVEAACWKGQEGSALIQDAVRGNFFRRYAAAACQQGILRLCFMRVNGWAAAMQLAVECAGGFWLLKVGYDEEFAYCSPGILLTLYTVRYAASRGLRYYEFLGATEPWTEMWTRLVRPCVSLRAYPANLHGIAALAIDLAKTAWSKWRKVVHRWR